MKIWFVYLVYNYLTTKSWQIDHVVKPGEAKEPVGGTSKNKTNKEAKTGSSKVNNVSNVGASTLKTICPVILAYSVLSYKFETVFDHIATFMASTSSKNEGWL